VRLGATADRQVARGRRALVCLSPPPDFATARRPSLRPACARIRRHRCKHACSGLFGWAMVAGAWRRHGSGGGRWSALVAVAEPVCRLGASLPSSWRSDAPKSGCAREAEPDLDFDLVLAEAKAVLVGGG